MSTSTPHPRATSGTSVDQRREHAQVFVQQVRAFQIHAVVFAAGMAVIFLVNLLTNAAAGITGQSSAWWSVWVLISWGMGVAVHGLVVWLSRPGNSSEGGEAQ